MRFSESVQGIEAFGLARPKFFQPPFRFRHPQGLNPVLYLIIETGNQSLGKPHSVPR